jgi:hypothetical protein
MAFRTSGTTRLPLGDLLRLRHQLYDSDVGLCPGLLDFLIRSVFVGVPPVMADFSDQCVERLVRELLLLEEHSSSHRIVAGRICSTHLYVVSDGWRFSPRGFAAIYYGDGDGVSCESLCRLWFIITLPAFTRVLIFLSFSFGVSRFVGLNVSGVFAAL